MRSYPSVLETQRLILRPMQVSDAEEIFQNWTHDPEVTRFMRYNPHETLEVTREWLRQEENSESETQADWGFVLRETGELIGSGGLFFSQERGLYELGYNLMKKVWNQGLATEAVQAILTFGRERLGITRVFACHAKDNPASGRVLEKAGFVYQRDGSYASLDGTRTFESREYLLTVEAGS